MADTVGLVGLGMIGEPIGERLLVTGAPPVVFDVRPDPVERLVARGAQRATSARELAELCDVILVCVQTDEQCIDVVTGDDGLLAGARPGRVVCVHSTVSPSTIGTLADELAPHGVGLLEAPMAGQGARSVTDASLFVLAGGAEHVRQRARPVLERFSRVLDTGPLGSGAALKLAHNVMVYVGCLGTLEAVELARAAGVRDGLLQELTNGTGTLSEQSRLWLELYEDHRAGNRDPQFLDIMAVSADLLEKDLRHAVALGAERGVVLPGSALCATLRDTIYPA